MAANFKKCPNCRPAEIVSGTGELWRRSVSILSWRAAGDDLRTLLFDHQCELRETEALVREFLVTADDAA